MENTQQILKQFFDLEIIKFGNFTLKSGLKSPYYIDLRAIFSKPSLLSTVSKSLLALPYDTPDLFCGVPYAALPLATVMAVEKDTPLLIKRKQSKGYGTNKLIEGVFEKNQKVLVIEDVITSGKSLLETIPDLEKEGLIVKDIVVVIDREQGGKELLEAAGYNVHVLFSVSTIVNHFYANNYIEKTVFDSVLSYIEKHNKVEAKPHLSFEKKQELVRHPVAKKLLQLAINKKSNLICAADLTTQQEVLDLADSIGSYIVAIKLHLDIMVDFDNHFVEQIQKLALKHQFLIFEDRKFADIGNTAALQFSEGIYKISTWVDMVTAHVIAGAESIKAMVNTNANIAIVPIVQMSSKGTLIDANYSKKAMKIVSGNKEAIIGVVAQDLKISDDVLKFTPGINLNAATDTKGQQYNTPDRAFETYKTDFIIVGRGIYQAENPKETAQKYSKIAWKSYRDSL